MGARLSEHHRLAALPYLVADRGLQYQFATRLQPEFDVVLHRAGDPARISDPGHGGEAHAGDVGDRLEDGGHGVDAADGRHVAGDGLFVEHWRSPVEDARFPARG